MTVESDAAHRAYVLGRAARLPQWAREEIEALFAQLDAARTLLEGGPEDANVFADPFTRPRPIGKDSAVSFHYDPAGGPLDREITVEITGGGLFITGSGGRLWVTPVVSNVIRVAQDGC